MDFYQFYQLFKRHLLLLILVPLLLAGTVYLFTRDQPKTFSSSAIIYTGIATGYSIETTDRGYLDYYGTNVQFDNLINLFNSRQIIEQTAIRLLAQDISLKQPNPQYISRENWLEIQQLVPQEVKNLVVENGKMGLEREKEQQIREMENRIESLEKEIAKEKARAGFENNTGGHEADAGAENLSGSRPQYTGEEKEYKNIYHKVQSGETLYSIARQYNISVTAVREWNDLQSDELIAGRKLLIRKPVEKKTAEKENLQQKYYDTETEQEYESFLKNRIVIPRLDEHQPIKDPIVPPGVNPSDYWATVENLTAYYRKNDTNFIYELLHYAHKHYSINAINQKSNVTRIGSSDLIEITYQADDPGICQQTLKILSDVFIKNYKQLRINQTDAVVQYFQEQVDSANRRLQKAEDRLLNFNKQNSIINYYEQSRAIANQKEDLDMYFQNEQIRLASAEAAIEKIESKLASKDSIYLSTNEMQKAREQLQKTEELIFINQLDAENDPRIGTNLEQLKLQAAALKKKIAQLVDKYFMYSHSPQGMPIQELLTEWLENVVDYEEARAALQVLSARQDEFRDRYQVMAPLGAMLKRIEREIEVAEDSYMELLRSLNQAKMKQQNLEMATNIKIVDEPYFPITANSSMTKILVLLAAVIGFVLVAFVIIVLEYFDSTIKSPERVERKTKLKLAGAYPRFSSTQHTEEFKKIADRLLEIIIQNIKLAINRNNQIRSEKPYLIMLFSTRPDTGKTTIASNLIRKLREYEEQVLFLNYAGDNTGEGSADMNDEILYKVDNKFVDIKHIKDLINSNSIRKENYPYDYIFLEIPSIIHHSFPLDLIETVDLSLIILNAKDHWSKSDVSAMNNLLQVSHGKPLAVLNMAEVYALEDIVNKVPRKSGSSFWKKFKETITYPARVKVRFRVD